MSIELLFDADVRDGVLGAPVRSAGVNETTLTGDETLDAASSERFQRLDPGGASRDVTLPAEEGNNRLWYYILNAADAAEDLVVKNDNGDTIATVSQNEAAVFVCSGSSWVHMGIITIALS